MTTAIAIEDVRKEVKILKALSGHKHLIKFHDAFEDGNNVYIVMEYVFYHCVQYHLYDLWQNVMVLFDPCNQLYLVGKAWLLCCC